MTTIYGPFAAIGAAPLTNPLSDARGVQVATIAIGAKTYVYVARTGPDGVSIFELSQEGALTLAGVLRSDLSPGDILFA
jgi:hypothetical protein